MSDADAAIAILGQIALFTAVALAIYIVPSVVAFRRQHPNRFAILAVNLALGGTGIGWLGALVWALQAVHLSATTGGSNGGESGLNMFVNDPQRVVLAGERAAADTAEPAHSTPHSMGTAVAELERLSRLHAAGHLNDAEFATLKRAIMDQVSAAS